MSRQNYYAQRKRRQRQDVDAGLISQLVQQERQIQPRVGGRKLLKMLQNQLTAAEVKIGRDRFFAVLAECNLLLEPQPAAFPCTTHSQHYLPVFTNKIKDLKLSGANQEAEGCLKALEVAARVLPEGARPIHHSDRGSQYCSHLYVNRLQFYQLPVSMTEKDHCAENAQAERMNGILKQEYGLGVEFPTKAAALCAVDQGIWLYNTRRLHSALGYRVPEQVHEFGLN